MSKRAIRRHHQDRILDKTRNLLRIQDWVVICDSVEEFDQIAYRRANNYVVCSCYGCGNPRRHFGYLTRQEIKAGSLYAAIRESESE